MTSQTNGIPGVIALGSSGLPRAVLVVDDEPASVNLLRITLGIELPDTTVHTATDGATALKILAAHPEIAVAVIDQRMPEMTGTDLIQATIEPYPDLVRIILTGYTDIDSLIQAINAGRVYRYLTKPWKKEELVGVIRQGLELHRMSRDNRRLQDELRAAYERLRIENAQLRSDAKQRYRFSGVVGNSAPLRQTLKLVERVADTDSTVLISGETGSGKELIARAIHYNGGRSDKPFISENCAAIAPDLLTSELFGHKRGAFTGANEDRQGLFEAANGGTLFLDEIGDCPPELQTRLLRVLDQGEIRRVGDNQPIKVDVRVIAATHHDLEQDVENGRFRRDLFYRLSVFTIHVPPLRERKDDIPALVQHILGQLAADSGKHVLGVSSEAMKRLMVHDYPGNVRELQNEVERAFAMADHDEYITPDLLSPKFTSSSAELPPPSGSLRGQLEEYEAKVLRAALERSNGNQTHTATQLGISRRSLIDKLQRYGIK
ncbi:MAG: sigma-54-dependent Fis family transcriptional regulator [Deltaproteobacteria bacterium]|nr:sigma-54-dependent Fis family transcriptional regulator [Deltaproteobacteria bacterium]